MENQITAPGFVDQVLTPILVGGAEDISSWPISSKVKSLLRRAGVETLSGLPEFLDDLKAIKGLGPKGISEIREWVFQKFKRTFKPRPKVKKKVIRNYKECRLVIDHFLPGPKNWAQQMKLADTLIEKYGHELLLKVTPNPKVFSLKWFISEWGDKYIRQFMSARVIPDVPVEEPEVEPCEFVPSTSKPLGLKDFLKL